MKHEGLIPNISKFIRSVFYLSLFGLVSCAKPVPILFNDVCKTENDNIYVSVEGYLTVGASVLCSSREGTRTCGLEFLDTVDGTNKINVYLEEGTGKSQMEPLPKSYGKENLKVHDHTGRVIGPRQRVRIIGIARNVNGPETSSYKICYINVQKIEVP